MHAVTGAPADTYAGKNRSAPSSGVYSRVPHSLLSPAEGSLNALKTGYFSPSLPFSIIAVNAASCQHPNASIFSKKRWAYTKLRLKNTVWLL